MCEHFAFVAADDFYPFLHPGVAEVDVIFVDLVGLVHDQNLGQDFEFVLGLKVDSSLGLDLDLDLDLDRVRVEET